MSVDLGCVVEVVRTKQNHADHPREPHGLEWLVLSCALGTRYQPNQAGSPPVPT